MKSQLRLLRPIIILPILLCLGLLAATAFYNLTVFFVEMAIAVVIFTYLLLHGNWAKKQINGFLLDMGHSVLDAHEDTLALFPMPTLVTDVTGEIVWYNPVARKLVLNDEDRYGSNIKELLPAVEIFRTCPAQGYDVSVSGRLFTVYNTHSSKQGRYIFYFIENTKLKKMADEYLQTRPSIFLITIDNYDELQQIAKDNERSQIFGEIEVMLNKFAEFNHSLLEKIERDRYIMFVQERDLQEIIKSRFSILDNVRTLEAGDRMPATLSIGVGQAAGSLFESEQMARQALDMSLGRGGDQAAVKTVSGYEFYGGVSKGVEKRTKVRTRITASAITELIKSSNNVIVMGHRFADLDCLGAAVGMLKGARMFNKPAVIAINSQKNLAKPLYDRLMENGYEDAFIEPERAIELVNDKTLLIVVDTHIQNILESAELYRACKTVVVIDHHRKMVGHIDNAVIFHHEPYASSASEMVAELLQYFGEKRRIGRLEAEALLSGIMLDTKNFVIKTGVRTFEAAAYLRQLGADTVEVRRLFASSMESYQRRSRRVAGSQIYRNCAIALADPNDVSNDIRIVAPQAADELLNISNVDASFVLYEDAIGVSISARSMGAMNVQLVMERLGGGGHLTMAGAQIKSVSIEDARQQLLEAIDDFCEPK